MVFVTVNVDVLVLLAGRAVWLFDPFFDAFIDLIREAVADLEEASCAAFCFVRIDLLAASLAFERFDLLALDAEACPLNTPSVAPSFAVFASEARREDTVAVMLFEDADAAAGFFVPDCTCCDAVAEATAVAVDDNVVLLLRREAFGCCCVSCDMDESESELDELLSDPLELPLDDDEPELEAELESVLLVDCAVDCDCLGYL